MNAFNSVGFESISLQASLVMAVANALCKQAFHKALVSPPNFYRLASGPLIGRLNSKITHYWLLEIDITKRLL